jgi:hypothetical protein
VLIPEEAAPQFLDDAAARNGMMPPPDSEMIAPPSTSGRRRSVASSDRPDYEPICSASESPLVRSVKRAVIEGFAESKCSAHAEQEVPLIAADALRLLFQEIGEAQQAKAMNTIRGLFERLQRHS